MDLRHGFAGASGGGFAVRQLYSDQDEVLFEAVRPIILNGIEDIITRPISPTGRFLSLPSQSWKCNGAQSTIFGVSLRSHGRAS